jgi:hypothetical protein
VPLVARTTRQDKVRELQRTLYRAAKADPGRRFHALYDKIYRRDVLERAWDRPRGSGASRRPYRDLWIPAALRSADTKSACRVAQESLRAVAAG